MENEQEKPIKTIADLVAAIKRAKSVFVFIHTDPVHDFDQGYYVKVCKGDLITQVKLGVGYTEEMLEDVSQHIDIVGDCLYIA